MDLESSTWNPSNSDAECDGYITYRLKVLKYQDCLHIVCALYLWVDNVALGFICRSMPNTLESSS